jgi:hypothetical protein
MPPGTAGSIAPISGQFWSWSFNEGIGVLGRFDKGGWCQRF